MDESNSLQGKKILVTRTKKQAKSFIDKIQNVGGIPIELPMIKIKAPPDNRVIVKAIQTLASYDWLVLTSINGAKYFLQFLREQGIDVAYLNTMKVAVVGDKTASYLESHGIHVTVIPKEFIAEDLLKSLHQHVKKEEKVLFLKGNLARSIIEDGLRQAGVHIDSIPIYVTEMNEDARTPLLHYLRKKQLDIVTFTSSSTVDFLMKLIPINERPILLNNIVFACIGPITANALRKYDIEPTIIARKYTIDGLLDRIIDYYKEGL